ncbi:hypothetical protein D9757_001861 [Collybiopsis confluens]|uniref:Transcription initiation factor TFIID subunit 13 n=1 Tax=Collybiopsis confluens TaxID=2823264 RepID=A0A8H5MEX2_9AGAR|nr:hypothetical protein D9757_007755 [Collybiopsis confluens]KAF5391432.1 hypothetical protein D9757_001861 [Collybiopsis confluens]
MSYYPPPVTPGAQSTPTTATYSYGTYQPYYYQWPPYSNYAVAQTSTRPASTTVATPATATSTTATIPTSAARPAYTPYTSSYTTTRDSGTSTSTGRGGKRPSSTKGLFAKELRNLMYGFGDDRNPANDTVNVMEEILVEYIVDMCHAASGPGRKSRLSIEDLRKALSRPADAKKLARMEELLFAQEDIKRARQQFDTDPKMA